MVTILRAEVAVFALDNAITPVLARSITRHHWPLFHVERGHQALRHVDLCRPRSIIVQVPGIGLLDESLALIALLRRRASRTLLIAVAPTHHHDPDLETAIRGAGVSAYISTAESHEQMERVIAMVMGRDVSSEVHVPRTANRHRVSGRSTQRPP